MNRWRVTDANTGTAGTFERQDSADAGPSPTINGAGRVTGNTAATRSAVWSLLQPVTVALIGASTNTPVIERPSGSVASGEIR